MAMLVKAKIAKKPAKTAQRPNITGVWNCNDGGRYYIRQVGRRVVWAGLSNAGTGVDFTNVFRGTRIGNVVTGSWFDVPRGFTLNRGTLTFEVFINTSGVLSLRRLAQTGGFGGSLWTFLRIQGLSRGFKKAKIKP